MPDVFERAAISGRQLRDSLARPRLTIELARLYSQHVRLRSGQEQLPTFDEVEAGSRLFDAVRLVDASFAARSSGERDWRDGLRRAGEVLEWLAHPEMNSEGLPLSLLGAAVTNLPGIRRVQRVSLAEAPANKMRRCSVCCSVRSSKIFFRSRSA